jgi:hypothetical protein
MSTTLVVMSSVQDYGLNSTHDNQRCTHETSVELSFLFSPPIFFFDCSRNLLGHRKDTSKEGDETIVNHFHEVSSSSEAHNDVCIHCTSAPCVSIMRWTSGMEVVHPVLLNPK